jgi:hypothetical protein
MGTVKTTTKVWTEIINERDNAVKELAAYKKLVKVTAHKDHVLVHRCNDLEDKLAIAVEALSKYASDFNWNEYTYYDGEYTGPQLAQNALAEIERIGGTDVSHD